MSAFWKKTYLAGGLFLAACAGSIPQITSDSLERARVQWPDATMAQLESGRQTYMLKCSGCHSLVAPQTKTATEWKRGLEEMKTRAKLSEEETDRIFQYLYANARDEKPER
jgi:cytochrome c5